MTDQGVIEAEFRVEPLPPYATAADALAEAVAALRPVARVKVSETAPRRMVEVGGQWVPYRWDVAPYMREPGDVVTSRRFDSVVFVGPARSSKSEGLVINPLTHAILAQPRKVAVFSPTEGAAKEWSAGALDPLIAASPELSARVARGRGADNVFSRRFRGGCRLTVDWPVKSKLAQRSLDLVIGTDYDAFPEDIAGDGGAFALMRKRTEAAGSRGMTVIESSPRFPIQDETWSPSTPHEAPPCDGIVGHYQAGSRARLYWTCPHCGEQFVPEFDCLQWPEAGDLADRAAAAFMVCPHCGGVIEARQKADLNAGAVWLHEDTGGALVPLADLSRRVTTASYWLPGPAAALAPWSRLVSRVLEAEAAFEARGDESALKAVYNTELGLPYLPRALSDAEALSADSLRRGATSDPWGVAPAETAFLTAAVDVQKGRFVVQVCAWRADLSRVLIDRFDIVTPPPSAPVPEGRALSPGRYCEDWDALLPIFDRVYPVAGADHGLKPLSVICDAGGEAGVTPNAYAFYRRQRRDRPRRFRLVRGRSGDTARRAHVARPDSSHAGKRHAARDVQIVWAGVDRLKDEISASLLRGPGGARKLSIPETAPADVFDEAAAERRGAKGWEKRPGLARNEALDLFVYDLAQVIALEAEALSPERPPAWATPGAANAMAAPLPEAGTPAAPADTSPAPAPPRRAQFIVKKPRRKRP